MKNPPGSQRSELPALLKQLAAQYPSSLRTIQQVDVPRMTFHISTVLELCSADEPKICDIGGGVGLFPLGCAAVCGKHRVTLIDDFLDSQVASLEDDTRFALHRELGVEIISRDVLQHGIRDVLPSSSFDVITLFECMEHFHQSPKTLLQEAVSCLKPGGHLVISVPNSAALWKRLKAIAGQTAWSPMSTWYEEIPFRGHVREPSVADLRYIARSLELTDLRIFGQNWWGFFGGSTLKRFLRTVFDKPLRPWPTLCSTIYFIGKKAA